MQKSLNTKGFTLIEVLVTVAVTGILMTLASVIFINTVRNSKKAEVSSEARQNAALVIDRIQKDARAARDMSITTATRLIINKASETITWECTVTSGSANGFITRQVGLATPLTVTNKDTIDGVSLTACGFSPIIPTTEIATLNFTLSEGKGVSTGPQEYQVNLEFRTSIATRDN